MDRIDIILCGFRCSIMFLVNLNDLIIFTAFFFKVLNGLLEREDWKVAIKTPLGVIPAGTIFILVFDRSMFCFLTISALDT